MKYVKLSVMTLSLGSIISLSAGDINLVEPELLVEGFDISSMDDNYGIYIGLGYTYIDAKVDGSTTGNAYTFMAGYNINEYLSTELRYSTTVGKMDVEGDKSVLNRANGSYKRSVTNTAIYLKPQYNLIDELNVYALLGYGKTNLRATDVSSFQWALGASYSLVDNLNLYVDYTNLTSDDIDNVGKIANNTWESQVSATTVGLSYTF